MAPILDRMTVNRRRDRICLDGEGMESVRLWKGTNVYGRENKGRIQTDDRRFLFRWSLGRRGRRLRYAHVIPSRFRIIGRAGR